MIALTRRYRFSAAHRLHSDALPPSVNRELFGKCNNPFGHGHNYVLEVRVRGPLDRASGQVVRTGVLDELVEKRVLRDLDRRDLNRDVAEFAHEVPTTENLARWIERRLRTGWRAGFPEGAPALDGVRIFETRNNTFELKS